MANDQVMFSTEETQGKTTETTQTQKVFSTKRPHEAKASKTPCKSPSDKSPSDKSPPKIAKVSPTRSTPTKATNTRSSTPSKASSSRWLETSTNQRDSEIEKLRRNLQKCQDELREEVEKRGMSSAARTASDKDRSRLLSEIKQLGVSKRRLESALGASQVAVKRMEGEVKAAREACKLQVASTERSSALEVKKLLEDLRVKDQMLASLDRNQYSDRSVQQKIVQQKQQQQQQQQQQLQLQQMKEQLQKDMKKELQLQIEREIKQELQQKLQTEMQQKLEQQLLQQQHQFKQQLQAQQCNSDSTLKQQNEYNSNNNKNNNKNNNNNSYISSLKFEITKLKTENKTLTDEKNEIFKEKEKVNDEKKRLENKMESLRVENDRMSQTLTQLQEEVSNLNESLADSKVEEALKQFEELKRTTEKQKTTIEELEAGTKKNKLPAKVGQRDKKTVRFLLPDSRKAIVNGRIAYKEDMRFLFFDDDDDEEEEDDDEGWHDDDNDRHDKKTFKNPDDMSESSDEVKGILSTIKKPDPCTSEDYTKLMNDHVRLEKAYTNLSNKKIKEWSIERESLNLAIIALEGKNQEYESVVRQLLLQVDEIKDKNEELEFQVLELEGCRVDFKEEGERDGLFEELQQKNRILEDQVTELSRGIHLMHEPLPIIDVCKLEKGIQCMMDEEKGADEEVKKMDGLTEFESTTTFTISTTSGVEDLSSDEDEGSIDSMPHDNERQANLIPCYAESTGVQDSDETAKKLTKVIGNLELRLACSKLRENSLLDKIALLCEEKKRLILESTRVEDGLLEEYEVIEQALSRVGCSVDGDDFLDSGVVEDMCELQEENDGEEMNLKSDEINSSDVRKVAAKLKKKVLFEKSSEGMQWIEECLRLDTPTKEDFDYPHYIQSLTGEGDTELLHQKVLQLEKDRDTWREVVDFDEGVIREFQIKLFDLENSERNLQSTLQKLEDVNRVVRSSKEELEEDNEKLRRELIRIKISEEQLQSSLDISKSNEKQLKKKLEEVSQDLKETEKKLRKKSAVAEKLEEKATQSNEKFEDQLGELEAVIELFKKRNSNLERLCEDLNGKLMETEKQSKRLKMQAECMEQQRETFVSRIQCLEKERALLLEKLTSANKALEARGEQLEMVVVEGEGLRMRLEALEGERNTLLERLEGQKDVEMIMMTEMEVLQGQNSHLKDKLLCLAQDKRILSINSESQTSFDEFYQEDSSQGYNEYDNDEMKVSLSMPGVHGTTNSHDSIGLLCDDDDDLNDYDYDKYEVFSKLCLKRTKSLNDLNPFISHKLTQTTPHCHRIQQGLSLIPINKDYHNRKLPLFSRPPSISQPSILTSMNSPLLASH